MNKETVFIQTEKGEVFWGGRAGDGYQMPFAPGFSVDLHETACNQVNFLLLSNHGRVVWSDKPFAFTVREEGLHLVSDAAIHEHKAGETLKDACIYAQKNIYPPHTALPPEIFFTKPQFNSWIELIYDQNEKDILTYAEAIVAQGYPAGVLMIDDNWQEDYGVWRFHEGRFQNPKAMTDRLHALGFKVMLWVAPFVSPDCMTYRQLRDKGFFVKTPSGDPYMVSWWNGFSAVLDLSNPGAWDWFKGVLDGLMADYGIDGFKFDAGAPTFYPKECVYHREGAYGMAQTQLFTEFSAQYPFNELRETMNQPHLPCAQRLADKNHRWVENGLETVVPNSLAQSLMGYPYICPDMIGGGDYAAFIDGNPDLDQELVVRYSQASALLPMMQFSMAPWRVLNAENSGYCLETALLHTRMADEIMDCVRHAMQTGEPILRPMEYVLPRQGHERNHSQFFLGENILVAPVVEKGVRERSVILPKGQWQCSNGETYEGDAVIQVPAPLESLLWFKRA